MKQEQNSKKELIKAEKDKLLIRAKWLRKQDEHAKVLAERNKKQQELSDLESPKRIKRIGLAALIIYAVSITCGIIAIIVGGAVSIPLTIICIISFIAYAFFDAGFCVFNARNCEFAFLNIPTLGLFGLVDIIIRMKRAPLMREKYEKQIAELLKKEEVLLAEISELENKIGEAKENIKELKNK